MRRAIFVFGSNLVGKHGAGAARYAVTHHGAIYGQGIGLQGNAYAIPTKDRFIKTLPLSVIEGHIEDFLNFARKQTAFDFHLTPIGCGLAGYTRADILPILEKYGVPKNVFLTSTWVTE